MSPRPFLSWGHIIGGLLGIAHVSYVATIINVNPVTLSILAAFFTLFAASAWCGYRIRCGSDRAVVGALALALMQLPIIGSGPAAGPAPLSYGFALLALAPAEFGPGSGFGIALDIGSQWEFGFGGNGPQYVGVNLIALAWIKLAISCLPRVNE